MEKARTILIVDDEQSHAYVCQRVLEGAGYMAFTANRGADALRILKNSPIDLILVDVFMPEMDGLDLIPTARSLHPKIAVVAMSGNVSDSVQQTCAKLGARAVVEKPFDVDRLLDTVSAALNPAPTS